MATTWKAPTWRMPNEKNQNKFESYSLNFDSSDPNYIDCGNSTDLQFSGSFSVSCWAKINNTGTNAIISKDSGTAYGEGYHIDFRSGNAVHAWAYDARDKLIATGLSIDTWYHIVFVFESTGGSNGNQSLYINAGTPVTNSTTRFAASTVKNLRIGASEVLSGNETSGELSQVCIFDYALSSTQVSSLYNSGSPINPMTLKPAPIANYLLGGDASTGGDATNTLSVPNVAVPDASAFEFSTQDYIEYPYVSIDSAFTVSTWVKTTDTSTYGNLFSSSNQFGGGPNIFNNWKLIRWNRSARFNASNSSNSVIFDVNTGTASTRPNLYDGEWHHVVGIWDGTTNANGVKIFFDGVLRGLGTATSTVINTDSSIPIRAGSSLSNFDFIGEQANQQIWNTALTYGSAAADGDTAGGEVAELYNNGQPLMTGTQPQASNLKAWYKLDQSANWEADTTGNWQIPDAVSSYPQSFDFDNTANSHIKLGSSLGNSLGDSYSGDLTLSLWFNADTSIINKGLFQIGTTTSQGVFSVRGVSGTAISFGLNQIGYTSKFNFSDLNSWHHLVCVYKGGAGGSTIMYLDGVPQSTTDSGAFPTSLNFNTEEAYIGLIYNLTGYDWDGKISNVQFWNTEIPATGTDSVQTLYNNGVPLTTAIATDNLKAWYKLDNNEKFDGTNWSVENQKYPAGFDSALDFDRTQNDNIFIGSPSAIQNLTNITLSVWVKVPNTFSLPYYTVASKGEYYPGNNGSQWYLTIRTGNAGSGGSFVIYKTSDATDGTAVSYTTNIDDNKWHNIVCINDGTDLKVYIDGQLDSTNAGNGGDIYNGNRDLEIGKISSNIRNFDGLMSNMVIWGDSQETEIPNIYNNGTPATSYTNTPVAWWKLNNTTTGIQDSAGSNDGTNNGTTKVNTFVSTEAGTSSGMTEQNLVFNNVSSLNGESSGMTSANLVTSTLTRQVPYNSYSMYFDGTSDYIEVPDDTSLKPTSAITCSMWFKGGTQNTFRYLLSKYFSSGSHAYGFYTGSTSTRLSFYIRNSATTNLQTPDSTAVVFNDEWHHAVGVYDGSKVELYIDGVSNGSTAGTGSINYTDGLLYFGTFSGAPTVYEYDGLLANISIFNEALTSTEILKLYNSGVPSDLSTFNPQPVSWWSLGSDSYFNGADYICPDLVSTNNGTSSGMDANSLIGDAPNSSANGTSTNMTYDANLTGNAPNSSNNSFSVNMDYTDRETSVPS